MSGARPVKNDSGAGFAFEDRFGAYLAAALLARQPLLGHALGPLVRVDFQVAADEWLLDDVLVLFEENGRDVRWAVSVRSNRQIKHRASAEFVEKGWEELLGRSGSGFDLERDLLGLAMVPMDGSHREHLDELMRLAKDQNPVDIDRRIRGEGYVSSEKRRLWDSFRGPAGSVEISDSPGEFLGRFRYLELDFMSSDSEEETRAIGWCEQVVVDAADGRLLWDSLLAEVSRIRTSGGYMDTGKLRNSLRSRYSLRGDERSDPGYVERPGSRPMWRLTDRRHAVGVPESTAAAPRGIETGPADEGQDPVERLPPASRQRVEALRVACPVTARRLMGWLSDPAVRTNGALSFLLDSPPVWLAEADYHAWEAIGEYMVAYGIPGSDVPRRRAIEAGSPRKHLYLVEQAVAAAQRGDTDRAESLLEQVPPDFPLLAAARARVEGDAPGVVEALATAGPAMFYDPDLELSRVELLTWAYGTLEQYNRATELLRAANRRFPGRAVLLYYQASYLLGMAKQAGFGTVGSRELLSEAVKVATRSRDRYRLWNGPSRHAVALATRSLLLLEDPYRIIGLSTVEPEGEATASEADHPEVQHTLAQAYLMLGRHDDLDALGIENISDPFDRALMRGIRAFNEGDENAASLIRISLANAENEPSRRKALWFLAMCGETDEEALSETSAADTALFRGVAAFHQGNMPEAIRALRPFARQSIFHATFLARAQRQSEEPDESDDAVETLLNAAEHLEDLSLSVDAVEMLMEQRKFDRAETIAAQALVQDPSPPERHKLRTALVEIAQELENWPKLESYARAFIDDFPQSQDAAWMVVYALHRQVRNQPAWDFLVAKDLIPHDEDTASLAITVCRAVAATTQDAERVLRIGEMYTDSEQVAGSALMTLMTLGDQVTLDDEQRTRLAELTDGFVARYPQSDIFRVFSAETPEEILETLTTLRPTVPESVTSLFEKVRHGLLPYGILLSVREFPYAAMLMLVAAGWLTAIPQDETRRERERRAARQAIGGEVAVDTSVVVLGVASELDTPGLGARFKSVLVADELVNDARAAILWAGEPVEGFVGYDSLSDRPTFTQIDQTQRQAMIEKAETVSEILNGWQKVRSGHLSPPERPDAAERLKPWDASLLVAISRGGCALWCDDLALRTLAEQWGIPTFGTWALLEALYSDPESPLPKPTTETKMRLLKAKIADVPISLEELAQAAGDTRDDRFAVNSFLGRPRIWVENPQKTLAWVLRRVTEMHSGPHRQRVPGLVQAACYGWGTAAPPPARNAVMGSVLGGAILAVGDPASLPDLVTAARYAANEIDPTGTLDPLPEAVKNMLNFLEASPGSGTAAQTLTLLFSEANPDDRRVVSIILDDR